MDIKTMALPAVTVRKDNRLWAYNGPDDHWKLIELAPDGSSVTIRHVRQGGVLVISSPDRVHLAGSSEGEAMALHPRTGGSG